MRDYDVRASVKANIYEAEFDNHNRSDCNGSVNYRFIQDEISKNRFPALTRLYSLNITDDLDKEIDLILRIKLDDCDEKFRASIMLWIDGTYNGTSFQQISRKDLYHLLKFQTFRRFIENSIFVFLEDWNARCSVVIPAFEGQNGREALWDCVYYNHKLYVGKEDHSDIKLFFPCTEKTMTDVMDAVEKDLETMVDYYEGESNERL